MQDNVTLCTIRNMVNELAQNRISFIGARLLTTTLVLLLGINFVGQPAHSVSPIPSSTMKIAG